MHSSLKGEEGADHSREGCRAVWQPSNAITCTSSNMIQHRCKEKAERVLEPVGPQDRYDTIKHRCHDSSIPTAGFARESFRNPKSQSHQKLTKLWGKMSWTRSHRQPTASGQDGGILFGAARSRKWKEMFLALVHVKMQSNAAFRCAAAPKLECPSNKITYFALKPAN